MPIIRYQIRNEYGLADPGLYRGADRDDPEALLEGVAMAGLVGVLRQLGDLAEFAAEIFHDLHEEVMVTAARGHGLMLRVQQLEAEFPAIEKAFLSQTSYSHLTSSAGIDWHPNLNVDKNVITRGDMPRFILDSYEECRGTPRLFVLDKFDIAGAGACLKRYSDPSFFKMDLASSGTMEPEIQREKKARKVKKMGPRWKNGEIPESFTVPRVNSKLQNVASDKIPENTPMKRVKLKTRQLNDLNASNGRSYMECVLERHSPEHNVFCENSASHCQMKMKSNDSSESAPEVHEIVIDTSAYNPIFRERTPSQISNRQEMKEPHTNELDKHITNDGITELSQKPNGEVEKFSSTFHKTEEKEWLANTKFKTKGSADSYRSEELEKIPSTFHDVDQKEPVTVAEIKTDGSVDGYRSDDGTSELDNYLDALATLESEMETDRESRAKPDTGFFNMEPLGMDSDSNEERQELKAHSLGSHSFENSMPLLDCNIVLKKGQSSISSADSSSDGTTSFDVRADLQTCPSETHEITCKKIQVNNEVSEVESSPHMVPNGYCTIVVSDVPSACGYREESCSSCVTESTSTPIPFSLQASPDDVQSDTLHPNKISSDFVENTAEIGKHLDSDLSPRASPDEVQSATAGINGVSSDYVESFEDFGKYSYDDLIHTADTCKSPSQTEDDTLLPGLVENFQILRHALSNVTDSNITESNIGMRDDSIIVKPLPAEYVEELTAEDLLYMLDTPDMPSQLHEAISENAPIGHVADPQFYLTECKEELLGSTEQDPEPDSDESTEYLPAFPLENSSIEMQTDGLVVVMENVVSPGESLECSRSVIDPENSGDFAERELQASGIIGMRDDRILVKPLPAEDVEELTSEDLLYMPDTPDMPSQLHEAISENAPIGHVADPQFYPTECKEELLGSMKQDPEPQSGESTEYLPAFPLGNSSIEVQTDGLVVVVENVVSPGESLECSRSVIDPENSGDFSERELQASGISSLESEHISDTEEYHVESAELLPSCSGKETVPDIPDVLSNASDYEAGNGPMPTGDLQTFRSLGLKLENFSDKLEYHTDLLELLPSCSGKEIPDSLEALSNASDHEARDGPVSSGDQLNTPYCSTLVDALSTEYKDFHNVNSAEHLPSCSGKEMAPDIQEALPNESDCQSRELPMPTCDHVNLHCSSMASNPPVDVLLKGHMACYGSNTESTSMKDDSDECNPVQNCPQQTSDISMTMEEDCISVDLISDQHYLKINETSNPEDSMRLAAQTTPGITVSQQEEDAGVIAHRDSKSGQHVLDSSDHSGSDLVDHVYHAEPLEHVQVDMSPINSSKGTISSLESEHHSDSKSSQQNHHRCSNLQEECVSIDSVSDQHKLDIPEASSQKDLARLSDQETPGISVSEQEEDKVVVSPRELKARECVLGSSDHAGSELLNHICHTELSEHAKLDLNPSNGNEISVSQLESEHDLESFSQPHPYDAANDISPAYFVTEHAVPSEESAKLQAGIAYSEVNLKQEDKNFEQSDRQFVRTQSFEQSITSNCCNSVDLVSQASEPEPDSLLTITDSKINGLDSESVLFQPTSELSVSSLNSNVSQVSLPTFPLLPLPIPQTIVQQSPKAWSDGPVFSFPPSDHNALQGHVEDAPPLPPLPPLEWRMGKLQLGSLMSDGGKSQPLSRPNPFTLLPVMDYPHGFLRVEGGIMHPLNPFAKVPEFEDKRHQHEYLTLEGEKVSPLETSRMLAFTEDEICKQGTISLEGKLGNPLPNSSIAESHVEDEKHLCGHEVLEKDMLPPSNPFAPVPTSFVETLSLEIDLVQPSNPFLLVSTTEDEKYYYDYRAFRGENVQHLNSSGPLSTAEDVIACHSFLTSGGLNVHFMDTVLPTAVEEEPNGKPHSILNRPRDPLIEAVASHDRSTLRKVSELVRPSTKPKMDERESLLEQIRNKSFNLKPAVVTKPNITGPATNLKVAAILEKANAIRQAVGSDEDDDGDTWSEC